MKQWMVILFSAFGLLTGPAWAQEWPTRPVKLIVPYPAGGGVDVMALALAQRLQDKWQPPFQEENLNQETLPIAQLTKDLAFASPASSPLTLPRSG